MHITSICQRSKKLLGIMYRRFYHSVDAVFLRLYFLVRPILEYASPVWDPYTQKNIHRLESVQKLVLKICSHCWDIDYHILLDMFTLPTLVSRREYLRTFKIITGCFYFPPNILFPVANPQQTRTNKNKNLYTVPFSRTLSFKSSFVLRTLCVCGII